MVPPISVKCASLLTFAFMLIMIILNITFFEVPFFGISDDQRTREVIDVLSLAVASTSDKGMVMCVGNDDSLIAGALYNVEQLRETYNSALPVSINHCNELSSKTMSLFTHYKGVTIKNVCDRETPKQEQIRLRGWFCKTKALISSDFKETIVVDTDVLWFKDPSRLFHAPDYLKSGALFFRDRFLYESLTEKDGLEIDEVKRFIEVESGYAVKINSTVAKVLAESNGINFFWRNAQNSTKHRAIRHVQESSVIIFDKSRLKKTIEVLRRLLLTFRLGYGDKEIYWIAATIAQENFTFEPHLAGSYGDCGEILHFDPFSTLPNSVPYFINCQYLAEGLDFVGKNIQNVISKPVHTTVSTEMFNMGGKDKKSAGRCGACKAMGCIPIPFEINDEIIKFQKFQLAHTDKNFFTVIARKICIFFNKLLYT